MSVGELAMRIEERRVTRNRLVQQIGCLIQSRFRVYAAHENHQKIFRSRVEVESVDVGGWL